METKLQFPNFLFMHAIAYAGNDQKTQQDSLCYCVCRIHMHIICHFKIVLLLSPGHLVVTRSGPRVSERGCRVWSRQ